MVGNINIYFGKVVNVSDESKICRCQISIDGLTDDIPVNDLPWYFPWYGLNYLPAVNDMVSVLVFDGNYSTCFYGRKVGLVDLNLDAGDYENYLEIFKRTIDKKNVSLTYLKSKGIQFLNDKTGVQIEIDKVSLFVDTNHIIMTKDRIDISTETEANILGDKGVKQLHDMIKHQANTITEMMKLFNVISAACVTPFTLPIKTALTPLVPVSQSKLNAENKKIDTSADTIQSKKVYIG